MAHPINIAFWGTPELTKEYLEALAAADMTPVVIITNPDRPKGRGHELAAPPAKEWALAHDIPVLQPEKLDDVFFETLSAYDLDVSVVVAYGALLPERFINLPKHKTLNVHYSLLPLHRGAAPTEAAILAGDTETGCSIQIMAQKLDSGPIIADVHTPIDPDETTPQLRSRLTELGAQLLVWTLPDYIAGNLDPKPQDESQATRFGKIKKKDALLDLSGNPVENYRKYRAYVEWPRTYFLVDDPSASSGQARVIITKAHMEDGTFTIDRVLPENRKEMNYADFMNGIK